MIYPRLGVDLGTTFTKMCFFYSENHIEYYHMRNTIENNQNFLFNKSEKKLSDFLPDGIKSWCTIGAGSRKYFDFFQSYEPKPSVGDEMKTNAIGIKWYLQHRDKIHTIKGGPNRITDDYIIASLGTGISYTYVQGDSEGRHVNGSAFGGGTLLGLCKLLIHTNDFNEILELASKGDSTKLDISIADIIGDDYVGQLTSNVISASFAKAAWLEETPKREDIAASLVKMSSFALGCQMAAVCGECKTETIFLVGGFLDPNDFIAQMISDAIHVFAPNITCVVTSDPQFVGALGAALSTVTE